MNRNIAVVLAGGVGSRLGGEEPKQFLTIAGRTVIEHTIDAFERNENIDEIAVVSHPNYVDTVKRLVAQNGWQKVKRILLGGRERYNSTLTAIRAYDEGTDAADSGNEVNLIFHDAARPLVSQRIINDVCEALLSHQAVNVVLSVVDTIIQVTSTPQGDRITAIPDRTTLRRVQTPQGFRLSVIAEAYRRALSDPDFRVTDDCSVVVKYLPCVPVHLVLGEERNMKLTYKEDLKLIEQFLNSEEYLQKKRVK